MKKFFYLAIALCMGFAVTSCEEDAPEIEGGNGTTAEKTETVTFEGDYWNALIDDPQYNGNLLYGEGKDSYAWSDAATGLQGGLTRSWGGMYGFAEGGTAISNYIDGDLTGHASWEYQLSVPRTNGSKNFVVAFCMAKVEFKEGVRRVIKSMDVSPTTYQLGVSMNGSTSAKALTEEDDYLTLVMTADVTEENPDGTGSVEVDMARDGKFMSTWKHVDLSTLGVVNSLTFTMKGSDSTPFGTNQPAYFAFDNVVVKMD